MTKQPLCTTTPYTDECGNIGLLWNCSGLGLSRLPSGIPAVSRDLAIDLSQNGFRVISNESFSKITPQLASKVKAIYLRNNKLQSIRTRAFLQFRNLCVLDLSGCGLQKSYLETEALAGLLSVKYLSIDGNSFQYGGYPDTEIARLSALQNISIDVFSEFHFNDNFTSLKNLSSVIFHTTDSSFYLTNVTFHGLIQSPVQYLDMHFKSRVYCDISEDLFCSFPFAKGIYFSIGGNCDLNTVLRSLKCLQNRTLDYLHIPENIKAFSGNAIILNEQNCVYLFNICAKDVDMSGNRISGVSTDPWKTRFGQCVETLDLSHNRLLDIDTQIGLHLFSFYPKLRVLYLHESRSQLQTSVIALQLAQLSSAKTHFTYRLSHHLQCIDLSNHYIHDVHSDLDITLFGSALEEFYLSNTNFPCNYFSPLQTPNLKHIDISSNNCNKIPNDMLSVSNNLSSINAASAKINFKVPKSQYLFKTLSKLQKLDLSYNAIDKLPSQLLEDQNRSLYFLNLDNNLLSSIPFTVSKLTNLSFMYVRHNRISGFQSSDIAILNRCKKVRMFIEGNPISCICSKLSSLKWMKENQIFFGDWRITKCLQNNQTLSTLFRDETFRTFELNCQTKDWLIYSSIILLVIFIIIILIGAILKYRVHVDYVILRLRHRWKGVINSTLKDDYHINAFLSYSEHDYEWVVNTMYHELTRRNVRVSLPDKDFIPGLSKADEMLRCIDESRKVVFVVTETFLKSGWESYAVQMTVTHAFHNQREGSMVVLMKDDIPIIRMPKDLRYVWWSLEVIKLSDFENNMDRFWNDIASLLRSN
jgi:Leucine-rich repeat (LRR) protein